MASLASTGAKKISFERLQGFNGVDEFEPAGWQVELGDKSKPAEPMGEKEQPTIWPMGVGTALMNGCFGSGYKKGDPCYSSARFATRCIDMIDAAAFIGVGFDGRGLYSAENRKLSIIQRNCAAKGSFRGKDVPDVMNAFGIYGECNGKVQYVTWNENYTVFKSKWQIVNLCSSKTTSSKAFKFSVNVGNN